MSIQPTSDRQAKTVRPGKLRRATLMAAAWAALWSAGCASTNVGAYLQRGTDLRRYQTYAWGPAHVVSTGDPRLDSNRFFDERVRLDIERALAGKGFEKAVSGTPDLLLHYHASITQAIDVRDIDREQAYCEVADCRPYVYDAGTLFIDLIDSRSNALVWRGWSEESFGGVIDDQRAMEARTDDAVARIARKIPRQP